MTQNSKLITHPPLVTVVIPCYNHAPYLRERIDSVLAQDYPNFEVLILDDKSPDNSAEIQLSYKGREHVREVIINEQNSGNTFLQWEKGVTMAQGKYIWIAESDDVAQPTFLSKLVTRLEQTPDAIYAYSHSTMIGPDSEDLGYSWDQPWLYREPGVYDSREFCRERLVLKDLVYNASMVVFRRECFFKVDPDFKRYRHCGDWFFWFEMAMMGKVIEVPEKLNAFRQHPNKVSNDASKTGADFHEMGAIQTHILSRLNASSYDYRVVRGRMTKRIRKLATKEQQQRLAEEWPLIFRGTAADILLYTIDKIINKSGFQNDRH